MKSKNETKTLIFELKEKSKEEKRDSIISLYKELEKEGYNIKSQLIGYLLTGDPTYLPRVKDARKTISNYDRNQILEEIIDYYINAEK